MRIVFMGTPNFALPSLKALHSAGHDIVAVYSQPPRPAGRGQKETPSPTHSYALEHHIPVFTPVSLKSPEIQAEFAGHKADIAVVAAYGLLLPKAILEAYPLGCINVHPSLLPRWRGAAPIQRTVMAGDTTTAICIMQMDEGLDTGDILLMKDGYRVDSLDAGALHDMLSDAAGPIVLQALEGLEHGILKPRKQSTEGVTYAKKITKEECRIDWSGNAHTIHNQIRGLSPSPAAYFVYNGEHIKIFKSRVAEGSAAAGTIMENQLGIACGQGVLIPLEIQRPNKKRMSVSDMLKGYPIPAGTVVE